MSLVSTQNPHDPELETVANNDFWDAIDIAHFRDVERLGRDVTSPRLAHALAAAIARVNSDLADWQQQQIDNDRENIGEVPSPSWQAKDYYPSLYRRAVYAHAHAWLLERYRAISATNDGDERGQAQCEAADDYRRDAQWAIREILQRPHITVELI